MRASDAFKADAALNCTKLLAWQSGDNPSNEIRFIYVSSRFWRFVRRSLCIVLDDAPPGIEAALAAGAKCLGVISRGHTWDQLYRAHDRVMNDLSEVTVERLQRIIYT